MLIPNLKELEDIGDKVDSVLLQATLKWKGKTMDGKKLERLRALFQITPAVKKVGKEATRFLYKLG